MPHVASQTNVLHSQHTALSRRDRTPDNGADSSPFSALLAETGAPAAPPRKPQVNTQTNPSPQRSDAARSETQRSGNAQRSDAPRSQRSQADQASDASDDATAAEAAPSDPAEGATPEQTSVVIGEVEAVLEAATTTVESVADPAADETVTLDAALAVMIETPPPAKQPVVAATPALAAVAAEVAAPATGTGGESDALQTAPVAGATPAPVTAPAAAVGEEARPPELQQAQVPQAPETEQQEATQTPAAASPAPKPLAKPAVETSIATTTNTASVTTEPAELSTAPANPETAAAAPGAAAQPEDTGHGTSPQHSEPAEKRPHPSHASNPEAAERPQPPRSAVSEFVQATHASADNAHLAHQPTGRDFGHTVAATAHASQSADASNPVVSAPVPLESVAVEIAARAQGGRNRFEIRLDPPELGRIEVRLDIDRSGNVTSRLVVDKVETLDALRRDAHQLERALQDAGLKTSDNSLQFSLRDQSFAGRNDQGGSDGRQVHVVDPELPATDTAPAVYGQLLRGGSGIDIRV